MKKIKSSLIKKVAIFLVCILAIFTIRNIYVYATTDTTAVQFNDSVLYKTLKTSLKSYYLTGDYDDDTMTINIITDYLDDITTLDLSGSSSSKIADVTGLGSFSYLTELNLKNNSITDVSPISTLTSLTSLDLNNNSISDISSLKTLTALTSLDVGTNKITDITVVTNMPYLTTLNISNNSLSTASSVLSLTRLKTLDVSGNKSISNITDVTGEAGEYSSSLTSLNLSNTSISELDGITNCTGLTDLDVSNCSSISTLAPIFTTYKNDDGDTVAILSKIRKLSIGYTTKTGFSFTNLAKLTSIEELYAQGNNISTISGLQKIDTLDYINLDDNSLTSIDYFYVVSGDNIYKSNVTKISLANNTISDISNLSHLDNIEYLDLHGNCISDISPIEKFSFTYGINLRNQTLTQNVYTKANNENQYMVLYDIMQSAKDSSSKAYYENSYFTTEGVTLNTDETYQVAPYYNVIITPDKTKNDTLTVTVHGGITDGTTITYTMSTSTSAIDTLMFVDYHLDAAIYDYLVNKLSSSSYIARAPYLINITQKEIANTTELDLSSHEIENLKGLSNFSSLKILNLADNNISDDSEIVYLTKLQTLNFANNKLNNSYSAIEGLIYLESLDLTNNNIKDLNSIENYVTNLATNKKTSKLTELTLSNNELTDISVLSSLTTLEKLDISQNDIEDISFITTNTALNTLNISGNVIEDITPLSSLTSIIDLNASSNIIQDISVLSNLYLTKLDLSGNRIKDISILSSQTGLTDLTLDNNMIDDVSNIEGLLLQSSLTIKQQKLTYALSSNASGIITIDLPAIFISAKSSSSKVYTSSDFTLENCTLSSDGTYIEVNLEELEDDDVASVTINGGTANGTTFTAANALSATITYSPSTKTKENVTATITFNRDASVLNNDGSNQYVFTENGDFTFIFEDEDGFSGEETATVDWIDNVAPEATVSYSTEDITNGEVTVTVTSSEEIANSISSWNYVDTTKMSISKTYTENTEETISIEDEVGNSTSVTISVTNIDKEPPVITGVEDGKEYEEAVKPVVTDVNLDTVTLTKDGTAVSDWTSGKRITEKGTYVLTATDKAGNSTTVTFTLTADIEEVDDTISSSTYTVDDTNLYITDTVVGTTVEEFKENIETEVEYTITDKNGNAIEDGTAMATGYKLVTETEKEYLIAVKGDVTGDGKLDISDVSMVASHVVDKYTIEGIYAKAADVVSNGTIDISDLSKLASALVGKATL